MPNTPDTHSQKRAPGPPMEMAVATPAMLPTPTVEARAVATAWNGVTLPVPPPCSEQLPQHLAQGEAEPAELHDAGEDGQQEAGTHQEQDHRRAPDVPIHDRVHALDDFNHGGSS